MAKKRNSKRLLVEGEEDKRVIPELIEANGISWGKTKQEWTVEIESYGGDKKLIDAEEISTQLKASGLSALGLIVDTDSDPKARSQSIRNACLESIPDLPQQIPEEGLIHQTSLGVKFGIWMMPDNKMCGMLETFLAYMIPTEKEPLWTYAKEVVVEAKKRGAPFKQVQEDKACIYTWLAWQKKPGRQLHDAVKMKIIDPKHPKAQMFVRWFKCLYDL